uniref:Ig-like domain-containing protein n=1 Tax=Zonotrichia albicollis TaxID=44394 RepID=A0A8D2M2A1_ZONAL
MTHIEPRVFPAPDKWLENRNNWRPNSDPMHSTDPTNFTEDLWPASHSPVQYFSVSPDAAWEAQKAGSCLRQSYRGDLEKGKRAGLHTRLRVSGCELLSDGSIRGSHQDGYDGRDFISFDLESGRLVAADSSAEITRRLWEQDGTVAEYWMNYLKHICPEWLQKYIRYGQKELERKEPPDVHVSGREEHGMLTLSCHAYGFYPNTIAVSWMKGGETLDQETEWGGVVPNSDGTFHTWARIEALPEEREQYRCRVEHPGMPEPGIFTWGEAGNVGIGNFRHLAGISLWWSLCPSLLPSSSSLSSLDSASGSSNPVTHGMAVGKGHGSTRHRSGNPVPLTLIPLCFHREERLEGIQPGSR